MLPNVKFYVEDIFQILWPSQNIRTLRQTHSLLESAIFLALCHGIAKAKLWKRVWRWSIQVKQDSVWWIVSSSLGTARTQLTTLVNWQPPFLSSTPLTMTSKCKKNVRAKVSAKSASTVRRKKYFAEWNQYHQMYCTHFYTNMINLFYMYTRVSTVVTNLVISAISS